MGRRKLAPLLASVRRHRQEESSARSNEGAGFRLRAEAGLENLTSEIIKSKSAIEGEKLDADQFVLRCRHLGMDTGEPALAARHIVTGLLMMLDANRTL